MNVYMDKYMNEEINKGCLERFSDYFMCPDYNVRKNDFSRTGLLFVWATFQSTEKAHDKYRLKGNLEAIS